MLFGYRGKSAKANEQGEIDNVGKSCKKKKK